MGTRYMSPTSGDIQLSSDEITCLPNHLHCKNGGVVKSVGTSGYTCECSREYHGDACHINKRAGSVLYSGAEVAARYVQENCCTGECLISFNEEIFLPMRNQI